MLQQPLRGEIFKKFWKGGELNNPSETMVWHVTEEKGLHSFKSANSAEVNVKSLITVKMRRKIFLAISTLNIFF